MEDVVEIKTVLLGNSGVGKTSVAQRFVLDQFNSKLKSTCVAGFLCKFLEVAESKKNAKFQIWDTAGQEEYKSMTELYYKNAAVALVIFDLNNEESFRGVDGWVQELRDKGPSDILIVLAANKADLIVEQKVNLREAEEYADSVKSKLFVVSAKEGINVKEMFEYIALRIVNSNSTATKLPKTNIKKLNGKKEKKKKCC